MNNTNKINSANEVNEVNNMSNVNMMNMITCITNLPHTSDTVMTERRVKVTYAFRIACAKNAYLINPDKNNDKTICIFGEKLISHYDKIEHTRIKKAG